MRGKIMRDVQCLPVVDAILVGSRSSTPVPDPVENVDDSKLTMSPYKPKRPVELKEEPTPESVSVAEQRRAFIASLPPPPPPPITPISHLAPELLTWTQLFNSDAVDDQQEEERTLRSDCNALSTEQFLVVGLLGKGAQGNVYLVKHRSKMVFYALKAIPKSAGKNDQYANLFAEQFALRMLAGDPRFVNLQGSFQDDSFFYILTVRYLYAHLDDAKC